MADQRYGYSHLVDVLLYWRWQDHITAAVFSDMLAYCKSKNLPKPNRQTKFKTTGMRPGTDADRTADEDVRPSLVECDPTDPRITHMELRWVWVADPDDWQEVTRG